MLNITANKSLGDQRQIRISMKFKNILYLAYLAVKASNSKHSEHSDLKEKVAKHFHPNVQCTHRKIGV
jgi:hypothetical protein